MNVSFRIQSRNQVRFLLPPTLILSTNRAEAERPYPSKYSYVDSFVISLLLRVATDDLSGCLKIRLKVRPKTRHRDQQQDRQLIVTVNPRAQRAKRAKESAVQDGPVSYDDWEMVWPY